MTRPMILSSVAALTFAILGCETSQSRGTSAPQSIEPRTAKQVVTELRALGIDAQWTASSDSTSHLDLNFAECPPVLEVADLLAALPRARSVSLTRACNLEVVQHMQSPEEFSLLHPTVSDVSGLRQLHELESLRVLADLSIVDASSLNGHAGLKYLRLDGPRYDGVESLHDLPNLETLSVRGSQVRDLHAIATLPKLSILDLPNTGLSDIAPLASASNLSQLDISDTPVSDLSALAKVSSLRSLYAAGTLVHDLQALSGLSSLVVVAVSFTNVDSLAALAPLTNLTHLFAAGLDISDLSPLEGLGQLRILVIAGTPVSDCSPIAELRELEMLNLLETGLRELDCIRDLEKLQSLYLGDGVTSFEPLSGRATLQELRLTAAPQDGFDVLLTLPNLQRLWVADDVFSNAELEELGRRLPNLHIYRGYHAPLELIGAGRHDLAGSTDQFGG